MGDSGWAKGDSACASLWAVPAVGVASLAGVSAGAAVVAVAAAVGAAVVGAGVGSLRLQAISVVATIKTSASRLHSADSLCLLVFIRFP